MPVSKLSSVMTLLVSGTVGVPTLKRRTASSGATVRVMGSATGWDASCRQEENARDSAGSRTAAHRVVWLIGFLMTLID